MPIVLPLLALDVLVLVLWTIALALAIALVMRKVGDVFRPIPVVGGYIAGAADSVAQVVSNAAGSLEHGADKLAGAAWHQLARYMDHLWNDLVTSSSVFAQMAHELARHAHALARLRALAHKAVGQAEAFIPRIKTLEREWHGIEHRVKALERELAKGIGNDIRIRIKALERTLGRLEHKVIPKIRSTADTAEAKAESALDWTREHGYLPNVRTLEAAGVAILSAVGLNWLRCDSNPFNKNKNACSLWGDLAGLLALATAAELALHVDEIVKIIEELTPPAVAVMNKAK